ncbi:MAG: hypothetical protein H0X43_03305 [Nitrosospira sp.]|nr:hypothetical protein [Nitrosospira sp.]
MAPHTENVADVSINLWAQMATQVISIVGDDGFNSLYARSIFLSRSTFPWLAPSPLAPQTDHRFAGLKMSFEEQTPAQASEANSLLLITFIRVMEGRNEQK